jgi:hypothetical protein
LKRTSTLAISKSGEGHVAGENMISLFVFWIGVNAIIGYVIGKSKNDISGCGMLSVILGPIGWMISFAIKGNVRKCPFCAEQIKSEANVCRYCGREVTPIPSVPVKSSRTSVIRDLVILDPCRFVLGCTHAVVSFIL